EDPSVYLEAFERLKDRGTIRTYGISTDSLDVLKRFNINNTCDVVETDYSLLNRNPEKEFLPYCQEHGIAVLVRGPLHKGLLSGKYSTSTTFTDTVRSEWYQTEKSRAKLARKLQKVDALKTVVNPGADMVRAAIRYTLSHPANPVAIPGAKSPEQAAVNAKAGDRPLTNLEQKTLVNATKVEPAAAIAS
ncbi:MAG: aldo/keto reductase, partial [Cyanobacteria bacterium J06648_11]